MCYEVTMVVHLCPALWDSSIYQVHGIFAYCLILLKEWWIIR